MKKIFAFIVIMFGFAHFAQAVIITNGDFATNSSGWNSWGWYGWQNVGNSAGSYLLESNGSDDADPWISQTVNGLTVGATYDLGWELYLHHDGGGTSNGLSFGVFLDGNILDLSEQLTKAWVPDQVSFTALAESATLMFAAELDSRTPGVNGRTDVSYYIDNISLTKQVDDEQGNGHGVGVPEPTTLLLLAAGLVGVGFSSRYKKAR